jgi:hypothetical protein
MNIEFEIRDFDKASQSDQAKVRRERGSYFRGFNPGLPDDCRQFLRCFERNEIVLDGHSIKDLAKLHPAFGEPECKRIIADLASVRKSLPELAERSDTGAAEVAVIKAALDENTDINRTEALFAEMRRKQDGAELAKVKVSTAKRRITELEGKLRESISAYRKREAEKLRSQLAPLISGFNEAIEEGYEKFVPQMRELLPQIAALEGQFAPEIYFLSLAIPDQTAKSLKTLKSCPKLTLKEHGVWFTLREREK